MLIFYIADAELPSTRANSVNIVKMCEGFAELGNNVELIIPSFQKKDHKGRNILEFYDVRSPFKIKIFPLLNFSGILIFFSLITTIYILFRRKTSEYLVFGRSPFSIALLSILGCPVTIDIHGKTWRKSRIRKLAFKIIARSKYTKKISFNTGELMDIFKKDFSVKGEDQFKLVSAPNGASPPKGNNKPFNFLGSGSLRVGYIGSLLPGRGVDLVIKIAEDCPNFEFHLAGGPSKEKEALLANCRTENIFFYGHIPHKDTYSFRAGCDILIAPYQTNVSVPSGENTLGYMSPIKIFEYMASSKPIICSDFPVLRNILNEQNSILVSPENLQDWILALKKLNDHELRNRLAQKAFQDFQNKYTWRKRAEKILVQSDLVFQSVILNQFKVTRMKRKVGIIGCGHISDTHIKSWQKTQNSVVAAVFDIQKEAAEKKATRYGIKMVTTDLDEIINSCDILDVCTPPQTHYELALKIIGAGKHLLIEKPLVTDVNEWENIKNALEKSSTQLAVLHNLKFALAVQKAKSALDQGRIGKLLRINRYFLTHPDSDRMLVGNNHWSHKLPGGRWYETMPHELYLTHYFAGWSDLTSVTIFHSSTATAGAPAEEVCFTLQNKHCISSYHYSSNCKMNRRYIELIGSEGTIVIDILSDMLFIDNIEETKTRRGIGVKFLETLSRLVQAIPDRITYFSQRQQGISPHTRIIMQFDEFLQGNAPSPTPVEEIDFVVTYSDLIGREIDKQLENFKPSKI